MGGHKIAKILDIGLPIVTMVNIALYSPCRKVDPQKVEKNNVEKVGSYILTYLHIPSYTSKYLQYHQLALYTFIYPHIHQNIEYWENDSQHKTQKWS